MLCNECGGDGWRTMADSHAVVTIVCESCHGTGCFIPEPDEQPEGNDEAFWNTLYAATIGDQNAYERDWINRIQL